MLIEIAFITLFLAMTTYAIRHYKFTWNRLYGKQRRAYQELAGHYLPSVSIIVPMHNEEKVAPHILQRLVEMDYPKENGRYEVIALDDRSEDRTGEIIDEFASRYPFIKAVHRVENGGRGKPEAMNVALKFAHNDIIITFDADYLPSRDCVKRLVAPFYDPEVGAVMGRVVPANSPDSLTTRLLDLERAAGYQVDQQARYNLDLIILYGGTVGGFRRDVLKRLGGWDETKLAEDTDLSFRVFLAGWKVVYVNAAEAYEEAVPTWEQRSKQLRRWAIGHIQCLFDHLIPVIKSPFLTFWQKVDGILLLGVFLIPFLMFSGWILGLISYLFMPPKWSNFFIAIPATITYINLGNFAMLNQVAASTYIDGRKRAIWLLPSMLLLVIHSAWVCTLAFFEAILLHRRQKKLKKWYKTSRAGSGFYYYNNLKNNDKNNVNNWYKTQHNGNGLRYLNGGKGWRS
ncbi:MAG TPA: glycosyltransferase family 2 protein [Candidatus Korarchaeota archaeon]|nr:glycosyltransferase family 2 protein [Candidatus Korarchaeota archaeon]